MNHGLSDINLGEEFVIGGYTPGTHGFDALIVGFYRGKDFIYAARVRAGFVPAARRDVFEQIKHLKTAKCPSVNLPELADGRWGAGLTAEKMKDCVWLLCRIRHSSHNVECRTMPHALWAHDFGGSLRGIWGYGFIALRFL